MTDAIREAFNYVCAHLDVYLQYSEANYQKAFLYFLSKLGTCQTEVPLTYTFNDGSRGQVVFGHGRMDVVFRDKDGEVHIIELKISPKRYAIEQFIPQVKRYMVHYERTFNKKPKGWIICWSKFGSRCVQVTGP